MIKLAAKDGRVIEVRTMADLWDDLHKEDEEDRRNLQWAQEHLEIGKLVEQKHGWAVTDYGVECLTRDYCIEKERLTEEDWPLHMAEKPWVDMYDFLYCFYRGRAYHFPDQYKEGYPYSSAKAAKRKRKPISSSTRFFVLQRDGFRCQICGKGATDNATLEIDHRTPVHLGGKDDVANLWTTCFDCNRGKGIKPIDD